MSIHKSLKTGGAMARSRNVYTRWERLQKLQKDGRWNTGDSVYGLAKVRTATVKVIKKKKGPEDEEAEGVEGAEAPAEQ